MDSQDEDEFTPLPSMTAGDIAFVESLLKSADIPYFVSGANQIQAVPQIVVRTEDFQAVKDLLREAEFRFSGESRGPLGW